MSVALKTKSDRLVAGTVMLLCPLWAAAASPPPPPPLSGGCEADPHAEPSGMNTDIGPHRPGPPGEPGPMGPPLDENRPPPFLMDARLSDDQQDKVFAIMHAAAPALRDQSKAARKARASLHELVKSPQFSDAAAVSLAQAAGSAEAQLALLRTRMEHELYAILTPDQAARINSRSQDWEGPRGEGPPHP